MKKIQVVALLLLSLIFMGHTIGTKAACTEPDGSLDVTFGNHGKVVTPIGAFAQANGVVVLPCGDIVAAGTASFPDTFEDFALARYTPYGVLNTSFGMNGVVSTDFATVLTQAGVPVLVNPSSDQAYAVALQENCDGCDDVCDNRCNNGCDNNCKIVVAGTSNVFIVDSIAVARYNCDGSLDTSFGRNGSGVTVINIPGTSIQANAVAIQRDGKIVLAGFITNEDGTSDFIVVRLNCDGTLDRTFGCDRSGIVTINFGGLFDRASAVKIQQDGKIVVAGSSSRGGSSDFALARLTADGRLDRTFGDKEVNGFGRTGKVVTAITSGFDIGNALVLIENCGTCCNDDQVKIVVVGSTPSNFALAGYTIYGELDMNFGQNGRVITMIPGSLFNFANAAALERDCVALCKIIVAGQVGFEASTSDFALARYTLTGSLDTSFGNEGIVTTAFTETSIDIANAVALQENGDIVAAGITDNSFALARYNVCDPCCTLCGLQCATCTPCP